jgi:hypothetical protein
VTDLQIPWQDDVFHADPYPFWHELRLKDPRHIDPRTGVLYLTRYDDVTGCLRHPDLGAGRDRLLAGYREWLGEGKHMDYLSGRLTNFDPPDHERVRSAVAGVFTPRRVSELRSYVEGLANELLDAHAQEEVFDVLEAVAHPLPSLVICELLGIPDADRAKFDMWTQDIAAIVGGSRDATALDKGKAAVEEEWTFVESLVAICRSSPNDHLLSALVWCHDVDGTITHGELISTVIFLFSAGHQTTRDLLGCGLLGLLKHRSEYEALVSDPGLAPDAVAECLRYDSSIPFAVRRALRDTTLGGVDVTAGTQVMLVLGAANRDPERFVDPDRFCIGRPDNRPLSFGGGIHYCLGAALARLEIEVLLRTLTRRFPAMLLAEEEIVWRPTLGFRGPRQVLISTG